MLDLARAAVRYGVGLDRFLRRTMGPQECRARIERQQAQRSESFLRILERGIYARPRSVYARLLRAAGFELPRVARLVEHDGLEGALGHLHDAGVHVSLDELKGRRPIRRGGLELAVTPRDFDNPLLARAYEASSSGSRSAGTRVLVDFDLLAHDAAHAGLFWRALELGERPAAQWRPVPPGVAGLNNALRQAKIARPLERWFSPSAPTARTAGAKNVLLAQLAVVVGRWRGHPIAAPEHVPLADAERVARWLARRQAERQPALLDATSSGAVRICGAAARAGLDISGTVLRCGGEPLTEAKQRAVADAGCRAVTRYSMAEVGLIGSGCARPCVADEVHLASDKLAVIQRERRVGDAGQRVGALCFTTLLPSCPKLLLNVESGDFAELGERACGCPWEALGLRQHLHAIRSYEKLSSEGMSFLGSDLLRLLEELLPARFGGDPTDYQLVEEEVDGLTRVELAVDTRVGPLDEAEVVRVALAALAALSPVNRMMAELWRDAATLRLVRRAPEQTGAGKILALHVRR